MDHLSLRPLDDSRRSQWIWVPGYEWAPAWVSWRSSDDYVGWAPLPPEAVWEPSKGFSTTVDVSYNIGIQVYNFCRCSSWPSLHPVLMPPAQNVTILPTTTNVTTVGVRNNAIYCGGPDSARINRRGEYSIPQYQLQRSQVVGAWPAPAEQQALLKQGVLAVRSPRVYPIFSATTQRSVTTEIPNGRLKPNGRPRSSPAPATQVATQPTPAALPPAATVQNTPVYDVTVGQQQPGQAPAYTVSGFQVARPQQIPSNPQPTPQSDSQPGMPGIASSRTSRRRWRPMPAVFRLSNSNSKPLRAKPRSASSSSNSRCRTGLARSRRPSRNACAKPSKTRSPSNNSNRQRPSSSSVRRCSGSSSNNKIACVNNSNPSRLRRRVHKITRDPSRLRDRGAPGRHPSPSRLTARRGC